MDNNILQQGRHATFFFSSALSSCNFARNFKPLLRSDSAGVVMRGQKVFFIAGAAPYSTLAPFVYEP